MRDCRKCRCRTCMCLIPCTVVPFYSPYTAIHLTNTPIYPFQTSSNTFYKIFFTFQILNFLFQITQNLYFYLNFGTPNATLFFSQCLCRFYPYVSSLNFEADEKTQTPSYKFQPNFYFLLFAETHSHVPLNVT